jgi:ppGpp synthetase/RelA/SpoT-type nucleotidyltranferase
MNRDEIDIFEYNLGGSVSEMMRNPKLERDPLMTEEQAAYFASQLLPGAATLDATGNMPGMPSSDADLIDIFGAENNPSFLENVRQGKILDPALQALGVLGDATYAIPALGATLGSALKAPGALRKAMKLTGGIDNLPQGIARAPDGIESVDAARSIAAIERGTLVDGPIRTTPIFQEFGIDRVREVEAALKRQQGDLLSVEDMVSRANTVNPSFQANIDSVAKSVGGKKADKFINLKDGSQFDVEVKTPKSIATKVERRGLKPADFTDGVRTTIYIDTADQAEEAVNQIGQMYTTIDRGWQRIPESGYFDRKMNVLVGDPATGKKIVAEIQIKTPEMFDAGEQGAHRWYDYSRKLEGRYNHEIPGTKLKLYNKALAEQRRLFGAAFDAADPAILEQLVDKFMQGGAVVAGPQSFRISFQNWA